MLYSFMIWYQIERDSCMWVLKHYTSIGLLLDQYNFYTVSTLCSLRFTNQLNTSTQPKLSNFQIQLTFQCDRIDLNTLQQQNHLVNDTPDSHIWERKKFTDPFSSTLCQITHSTIIEAISTSFRNITRNLVTLLRQTYFWACCLVMYILFLHWKLAKELWALF